MRLNQLTAEQIAVRDEIAEIEKRLKLLKKVDDQVSRRIKALCMPVFHMNQSQLIETYVDFVTVEAPKRARKASDECD